jgi:hypothetical protein
MPVLTLCDVLESEFVQLQRSRDLAEDSPEYLATLEAADASLGLQDSAYLALKKAHRDEIDAVDNLSHLQPDDPSVKDARKERDQREKIRLDRLVRILSSSNRTALCISGGGIRSATFSLGVMQGLSHYKLLRKFDYLSTVSGGGYIGSWLSAWRKRESEDADTTEAPNSPIATIEDKLNAKPARKLDGELPEIEHLRSYSNYLSPQLGFLSADTWTLVATVIRNMFLNWMILVPILTAALLIPKLALLSLLALPENPSVLFPILIVGSLGAIFAVYQIGRYLPSVGGKSCAQKNYLWTVLLPLSVSAVLLNTFWAAWGRSQPPFSLPSYLLFGGALHLIGWFFISKTRKSYIDTRGDGKGILEAIRSGGATAFATHDGLFLLIALASGAVGGAVAYGFGDSAAFDPVNHAELIVCLGFPVVMLIYFFAAALFIGLSSTITLDEDREWWARSGGWILIVALAWAAASALVIGGPHLVANLDRRISAAGGLIGLLSGWLGSLGGKSAETADGKDRGSEKDKDKVPAIFSSKWFLRWALRLAPLVFFLVLMLAISSLAEVILTAQLPVLFNICPCSPGLNAVGALVKAVGLLAIAFAVAWIMARGVNVNTFSLHAMYRSRLIRAYLGAAHAEKRKDSKSMNLFTGFDEADNMPIHEVPPGSPFHIVNMCLNLVHGERLAWQERKAETFTVSRLHAGSLRLGYQESRNYGDGNGRGITLGTAMAISGAAASPSMGYHSSPLLTFLMTFFNARLGWWLANPGEHGKDHWTERGPKSALRSLIAEALGNTDDQNRYVYLSDGGHFENLGLYEMVFRRCKTIVVIDAGADPKYQFEDLANAIRKIRVDLGVPIHFAKPLGMKTGPLKGNVHCAVATIGYGCIDGGDSEQVDPGILIYLKPVLDPSLSVDLDQYHLAHDDFPQQSTANQFFDESQFESYRRLGVEIIDNICTTYTGKDPAEREMTMEDFVREAGGHSKQAQAQDYRQRKHC